MFAGDLLPRPIGNAAKCDRLGGRPVPCGVWWAPHLHPPPALALATTSVSRHRQVSPGDTAARMEAPPSGDTDVRLLVEASQPRRGGIRGDQAARGKTDLRSSQPALTPSHLEAAPGAQSALPSYRQESQLPSSFMEKAARPPSDPLGAPGGMCAWRGLCGCPPP